MPTTKRISRKRRIANRENAKKSTGPRTDQGKQSIRLNSITHGLTGHITVVAEEDREAHTTFCTALIREMVPANDTERNLAQAIAHDLWRLNRARALETNMFAAGVVDAESADSIDPNQDPTMQRALAEARTFRDHANKFATLTIYEQRINRNVQKNRAEFRQSQAERREKLIAANIHPDNDLQPIPEVGGFAYASSELPLKKAA